VTYRGRVQGVGFRYTARTVAEGYAVQGFVRNLPDGRVQLVVEGAADEVRRFRADLEDRMADYIDDAATQARSATGEFRGFEIRR
jgi:acylphosphatase